MKTIYFVRHGQTDYNLNDRLQGHTDQPLNETGRSQARALGEKLRAAGLTFDRVFTSPLCRARETARIVTGWGDERIEVDGRIIEKDLGMYEGVLRADMRPEALAYLQDPYGREAVDGMESIEDVRVRMRSFWEWVKTAEGERILVASHGGALRALFRLLVEPAEIWTEPLLNCALYRVDVADDGTYTKPQKVEL